MFNNRSPILILFLVLLHSTTSISAQGNPVLASKDTTFPDSWDTNRTLRGRNGVVLLWKHTKQKGLNEARSCIRLVTGTDSTGDTVYYISKMYTAQKPFTKWHYGFIHYADYFKDTVNGFSYGFHDIHIESYRHVPTETELMALLCKWKYFHLYPGTRVVEAGIDKKQWLQNFGYIPDFSGWKCNE